MGKPRKQKLVVTPEARRRIAVGAVLLVVVLLGSGLLLADWMTCLPAGTTATYVGRESCAKCHSQQLKQWTGSHHDLAMDIADEKTVLGDFDDAELEHFGITSRMYRDSGRFMVRTEGPNGAMADFEVKYVLGYEPLQQYMVEMDRPKKLPKDEISRVQVLRITWDTNRKKWFYLSPPDVDESIERLSPEDDLHWTGITQCWNTSCADCHSTNLKKNFHTKTQTYHTTFSEIDVSCETCHGPGSVHVELAENKWFFWDRNLGYGLPRLKDKDHNIEIQACAPCHSHRQKIRGDYQPGGSYYDSYSNALLHGHLYHEDGQIMEEVYVYGSFIQSKMYHKQIRCTDCHNPHTARLIHQGNKVCTSCHQHPAGKYDTFAHHHHKEGSTGTLCVECHMPQTTYMDVDPRRDHSLRVPRPDLSVELGTPNACTQCHLDRAKLSTERRGKLRQYADWVRAARDGDQQIKDELHKIDTWAQKNIVEWYGDKKRPLPKEHFAHALSLARAGEPAAESPLRELVADRMLPAIVRATALSHLGQFTSKESLASAIVALKDKDPQIRSAALIRIDNAITARMQAISPLLATIQNAERALRGRAPPEVVNRAQMDRQQAEDMLRSEIRRLSPLVEAATPLLDDPVRSVRIEAARIFSSVPPVTLSHVLTREQRILFRDRLEEFKESLMVNNDRAIAHMRLGSLYDILQYDEKAAAAYRTAIKVEPGVAGARKNLAAVYERFIAQWEAEMQLAARNRDEKRFEQLSNKADEHRKEIEKLRGEELGLLHRDALLAPEVAGVQYQYGLALYLDGEEEEAEFFLLKAAELSPNAPDYLLAVALFYEKQKQWPDAVKWAERLVELRPNDVMYRELKRRFRKQASESNAPKQQ